MTARLILGAYWEWFAFAVPPASPGGRGGGPIRPSSSRRTASSVRLERQQRHEQHLKTVTVALLVDAGEQKPSVTNSALAAHFTPLRA